jgi:hypothetical protein
MKKCDRIRKNMSTFDLTIFCQFCEPLPLKAKVLANKMLD